MRCTFLANCGLLLQSDSTSVLVDSPNGLHTQFDSVSEAEHAKMVKGYAPYEGLCGTFFTHKHTDHFDKKRVREITDARQNVTAYVTNGVTPKEGVVNIGPFKVRYFSIPHSGEEFSDVFHRVVLFEAEGRRVYITGDADWNAEFHLPVLEKYCPDAAVWNPNFLTHEDGRKLLQMVRQNYIYHLPVTSEDVFGFGRKCRREFLKYGEQIPVELIDDYPRTIEV